MKSKELIRLDRFNNEGFDRGAGRVKELMWMIVKAFLFQFHFPLPSSLRVFVLRCFGAKVGKGVVIRSGVNVTYPWRLTVGDYCWIGEDVMILSLADVSIGDHCCISQRAFICTGSHDFNKPAFDLITDAITIEPHCWIAAGAFVMPGASLSQGTLVKANQTFGNRNQRSF